MEENIIESRIRKVKYQKFGNKTTVCFIETHEEFEIIGASFCNDVEKFDDEIGRKLAYEKAIEQLIMFTTYAERFQKYNLENSISVDNSTCNCDHYGCGCDKFETDCNEKNIYN